MQEIQRAVTVQPGTVISSMWAIPEQYVPGQSDAIILAHGAGNDMNHPFMSDFHQAFAAAGLLSIKFNFPLPSRVARLRIGRRYWSRLGGRFTMP